MIFITRAFFLALLVAMTACGGGDDGTDEPDAQRSTDTAQLDTSPEARGSTDTAAEVIAPDTEAEDTAPPEDTVPAFMPERKAWAWLDNPSEGDPAEVLAKHLTDQDGFLSGSYAQVWNCLNEDGGARIDFQFAGRVVPVDFCHRVQTVQPGDDGTYLHVQPPEDLSDPDDAFAEIMMYYNINRIHDYFKGTHGYDGNDRSLYSMVNVQVRLMGVEWMGMDNAMYVPDNEGDLLGFDIGMDQEFILFFQGEETDFSYESDIIHHEYTHFTVGQDRLGGFTNDAWGSSDAPISLNEAYADYFPASLADNPVMGQWAMGGSSRDLSEDRVCPDHIIAECHYDGRIWSSTLWDVREALGAEIADDLAFQCMIQSGMETSFMDAAAMLLELTKEHYPEHKDQVIEILTAHGLVDCKRVVEFTDEVKPLYIEGTWTTGLADLSTHVPGMLQYRIEVPEDATGIELTIQAKAGGLDTLFMPAGDTTMLLAVREGENPIQYTYGGGFKAKADQVLEPEHLTDTTLKWTIPNPTPGALLHLAYINTSHHTVAVTKPNLVFLTNTTSP